MRDFTICIGTTFVFGRDAETKVGDELGAKGVSRVLIHHDGGAYLETSGLLDAVRHSLGRAGISYTELGGVKPNPRLTLVREGIAIAKARNVDAVVAIGGGSVIDSAKAIALGAAGERMGLFHRQSAGRAHPSRRGGTDVPGIGQRIQPGRRHQQ